ncbi:MAG: cytochrome b [Phyllobacterium sp.]
MLRNSKDSFGLVSILFHWIIALIFLGQIALGYCMTRVENVTLQFNLFQWHKSFGFLVLGLSALRALWMVAGTHPRAGGTGPFEQKAARAVHLLLYLALFLVPLTGWAIASASSLRIPTFLFNLVVIPHLPLAISDGAEAFWAVNHAWLAYGAAVVAGGHSLAALYHHFCTRDATLMRMLDPRVIGADRTAPTREENTP